jgi:hypothetical protein
LIICVCSAEEGSKFSFTHSYIAGRLGAVATDSVHVDFEKFATKNKSIDHMHVNDANPNQLITQLTINQTIKIFCVINRKSGLVAQCDYIDAYMTFAPFSSITLAAYIDSGNRNYAIL